LTPAQRVRCSCTDAYLPPSARPGLAATKALAAPCSFARPTPAMASAARPVADAQRVRCDQGVEAPSGAWPGQHCGAGH
jgi:hypothetical protein